MKPRWRSIGRGSGERRRITTEEERGVATSSSRGRVQRRSLPQISPEAFISPRDRAALIRLQQTPLLPQLVRKFNEVAGDRIAYLQHSSASVR